MADDQPVVNIAQLPLAQLDQFKNSLEEEINMLTSSMAQLKIVQQKFKDSKEAVVSISEKNEAQAVLVPMTGSMYVPGQLKKWNRFVCDIGTGYYVEKDQKAAEDFFIRKIDYVTKNLEKLQKTLLEKHRFHESIVNVMRVKVQTQQLDKKQI